MTDYGSEAEVEQIIADKLLTAGCESDITPYSDMQPKDSTIRTVVFKAVIAAKGSSTIIDKVSDLGFDTDRGVFYKGSQIEAKEHGEIRYLFFEANINPHKDD